MRSSFRHDRRQPMRLSRRRFLTHAGALAAGPTVISARSLGNPAPSDRIQLGAIGVGRMGRADVASFMRLTPSANAWIVAVCDLDQQPVAEGQALVDSTYCKAGLETATLRPGQSVRLS
ncbi:MAG: hypothetical protein AAF961_04575 [Planctomycetota bacterium]